MDTLALSGTLALVRKVLFAIFLFGAIGTLAELLLLEHTEDPWQWVPIVLLGVSVLVAVWHVLTPGRVSLRAFQLLMIVCMASGAAGVLLHYKGNVEFELEMHPAMGGLALFREAMMGATPALAPGTMVQLGLIGLAYAFRHPLLSAHR
jgi:hypothetical protein